MHTHLTPADALAHTWTALQALLPDHVVTAQAGPAEAPRSLRVTVHAPRASCDTSLTSPALLQAYDKLCKALGQPLTITEPRLQRDRAGALWVRAEFTAQL